MSAAPHPTHWRWRTGPVAPGPAVVFDLDGVLADASGRQHHLERPGRDWDSFFAACGDDPVIVETGRLLEVLDDDLTVVLLTARPRWVEPETMGWLDLHGLRWDLLLMRDPGTYTPAREVKRQAVHDLRRYGFDLRMALEDDRRNVDMFHAEGIPCLYVHSGYYD